MTNLFKINCSTAKMSASYSELRLFILKIRSIKTRYFRIISFLVPIFEVYGIYSICSEHLNKVWIKIWLPNFGPIEFTVT